MSRIGKPGWRGIGGHSPLATLIEHPDGDWACLAIGGVQIEIVPADEKVASGAAGSVVYWYTDDFEARSAYLNSIGATLYRGPMEIENGWMRCQFRDPFGNLLGVRGPRLIVNEPLDMG